MTIGGGLALSTIRAGYQRVAGADFQFHIKQHYFQTGVLLSGIDFFQNTHMQAHACYGLRREGNTYNLALFAGPSFYQGVEGQVGTPPRFYGGPGVYLSAQAVHKMTYDIGAGFELFADIGRQMGNVGRNQVLYGAKVILFFSGSYRGPKRNFNPNVRSENPDG